MNAKTAGRNSTRLSSETLLTAQQLDIEKLPVLRTIIERLPPACSVMMREIVSAPTTFFLNQIETKDSWDVLESYEDSVAVVFKVPEWDMPMLIGIDRRFVFSLLEVMYGGDMSEPAFETKRPFSTLERRIGSMVCELAGSAFKDAFAQVETLTLIPERTETSLDFATLGQANIPVITAQLLFQVYDSGGRMFFVLPQAPLYPLRGKLERERPVNHGIADPNWIREMRSRIALTEVRVEAVMNGPDMRLLDIARLRIGQVVALKHEPPAPVVLECDGEQLFRCKLGQSQGLFTVQLHAPVDLEMELAERIIASMARK